MSFEDTDNRLLPVWQSVVADLEPSLSQQQRAWLSLTQPVGLLGTTANCRGQDRDTPGNHLVGIKSSTDRRLDGSNPSTPL